MSQVTSWHDLQLIFVLPKSFLSKMSIECHDHLNPSVPTSPTYPTTSDTERLEQRKYCFARARDLMARRSPSLPPSPPDSAGIENKGHSPVAEAHISVLSQIPYSPGCCVGTDSPGGPSARNFFQPGATFEAGLCGSSPLYASPPPISSQFEVPPISPEEIGTRFPSLSYGPGVERRVYCDPFFKPSSKSVSTPSASFSQIHHSSKMASNDNQEPPGTPRLPSKAFHFQGQDFSTQGSEPNSFFGLELRKSCDSPSVPIRKGTPPLLFGSQALYPSKARDQLSTSSLRMGSWEGFASRCYNERSSVASSTSSGGIREPSPVFNQSRSGHAKVSKSCPANTSYRRNSDERLWSNRDGHDLSIYNIANAGKNRSPEVRRREQALEGSFLLTALSKPTAIEPKLRSVPRQLFAKRLPSLVEENNLVTCRNLSTCFLVDSAANSVGISKRDSSSGDWSPTLWESPYGDFIRDVRRPKAQNFKIRGLQVARPIVPVSSTHLYPVPALYAVEALKIQKALSRRWLYCLIIPFPILLLFGHDIWDGVIEWQTKGEVTAFRHQEKIVALWLGYGIFVALSLVAFLVWKLHG